MVAIRSAQLQDVRRMHELQQLAFAEEGRRCGTRDIPPLIEDQDAIAKHVISQTALVASIGGIVVGCIRGVVDGDTCTIRGLVVDPAHQGKGIGSQLLLALEGRLPGIGRIDLTTNTIMEGNEPFYTRHGYQVTSYTVPAPGIKLVHMSKPSASAA